MLEAQQSPSPSMDSEKKKWIAALEAIRWQNIPECPYCSSRRSTSIEGGLRHHCNECYTSYSVKVGTLFHHSHLDLAKWFRAIFLVQSTSNKISVRQLAKELRVSKNTATQILKRLREASPEEQKLLERITKYMRTLN